MFLGLFVGAHIVSTIGQTHTVVQVSDEGLRFDLNLPRAMTSVEVAQVEALVNSWIEVRAPMHACAWGACIAPLLLLQVCCTYGGRLECLL